MVSSKKKLNQIHDSYKKEIRDFHDEIGIYDMQSIVEETSSITNDVKDIINSLDDKFCNLLYTIFKKSPGNRTVIGKSLTIRDGSVYKYDKSDRAHLYDIMKQLKRISKKAKQELNRELANQLYRLLVKINTCIIQYISYHNKISYKTEIELKDDDEYNSIEKRNTLGYFKLRNETNKEKIYIYKKNGQEFIPREKALLIIEYKDELNKIIRENNRKIKKLKKNTESVIESIERDFAGLLVADGL
jgi:hypothetical protein